MVEGCEFKMVWEELEMCVYACVFMYICMYVHEYVHTCAHVCTRVHVWYDGGGDEASD